MGIGEFNAGGNPAMDWHPIQGGVEIFLVASCHGNRDKLRPDGPLGSYADFNNIVYRADVDIFCVCVCVFSLQLPTIIADNAGYDSADLVAKLRAAHTEGKKTYGLGKHFVTHNLSNCEQYDSFYCDELARLVTDNNRIKSSKAP